MIPSENRLTAGDSPKLDPLAEEEVKTPVPLPSQNEWSVQHRRSNEKGVNVMPDTPINLADEELMVLINILADRFSSGVTAEIARPFHGFYVKIRSATLARGIQLPRNDALVLAGLE